MNTEEKFHQIEKYRDSFILELHESSNRTVFAKKNSENLFNLGLTMYSKEYSLQSAIYNGFAVSYLDDNISLHPEQMKILNIISENIGTIFSAPTSFGKTFVIFEYIVRYKPKNVVLIVPTLALVDEYKQRVINKYKEEFSEYRVYLSINPDGQYDFSKYNLFILTHDRVVTEDADKILKEIDFLVIDEVYKLKKDMSNDRVLILNLAYKLLAEKARKYVLLAPFLKNIKNIEKLKSEPNFYSSNFAPVVNEVIEYKILDERDREEKTSDILLNLKGKTLVYFPTVSSLNKYDRSINILKDIVPNPILDEFIDWAKEEIHEEWSVLKALERGVLVHNGQLPLGIRMIVLELFNDLESNFDVMLCTSTLIEGVNTAAEHIIITKPARSTNEFDAFDFFNLVGRTGRLYRYYLGTAHYIRGPEDREYLKGEALKSIEFEVTSESIDMDINNEHYQDHPEFIELLNKLSIPYEDYKTNLATVCRFSTVKFIYTRYQNNKSELINAIKEFTESGQQSKLKLIRPLYKIIESNTYNSYLNTYIINVLTYKTAPNIRQTVEKTREAFKKTDIDLDRIITTTIKMKSSYIEHEFYKKISVVLYFMKLEGFAKLVEIVEENLMTNIEKVYFINSPSKKILKDIGVYDRDIKIISAIINEDFETVNELKKRIQENFHKIEPKIGIVTKYILRRLIE